MNRFIIQVIGFVVVVAISFIAILFQADGRTDAFYLRFTSPRQTSLILGTSRAAQALQPRILDSILDQKIYNYAFTAAQSPYGKIYLNSIKKKLSATTKNATFILSVDPWAISSKTKQPNDSLHFREVGLMLDNTPSVSENPNLTYLFNNLGGQYYKILFPINTKMYLHDDGWLELSLNMDSRSIKRRTATKLRHYRENTLPHFQFSSLRLAYLVETIQYLKQYGKVYIVRLPVSSPMMAIEEELMADFDTKIKKAIVLTEGYLDLTPQNNNFVYTDGNHLYKKSGAVVSQKIAKWIQELENNRTKNKE